MDEIINAMRDHDALYKASTTHAPESITDVDDKLNAYYCVRYTDPYSILILFKKKYD